MTSVYPTTKGLALLVDAGANTDSKPEYLQQFAVMGYIYGKVMGVERPRVGLLMWAPKKAKGDELTKKAYDLLKETNINFIGNIEGRTMAYGEGRCYSC